jgi:hypothetical protein
MEAPGVSPGTLYLKDHTVELVHVGPQQLTTVTPETLRAYLDTNVVRLASRAGTRQPVCGFVRKAVSPTRHTGGRSISSKSSGRVLSESPRRRSTRT